MGYWVGWLRWMAGLALLWVAGFAGSPALAGLAGLALAGLAKLVAGGWVGWLRLARQRLVNRFSRYDLLSPAKALLRVKELITKAALMTINGAGSTPCDTTENQSC